MRAAEIQAVPFTARCRGVVRAKEEGMPQLKKRISSGSENSLAKAGDAVVNPIMLSS